MTGFERMGAYSARTIPAQDANRQTQIVPSLPAMPKQQRTQPSRTGAPVSIACCILPAWQLTPAP